MKIKKLCWIFGLLFLLSSCLSGEKVQTTSTKPSASRFSQTLDVVPTNTSFAQPTLPPPAPTLALELQDQFYNLLLTNGNCELPCFWGITPGETSFNTASLLIEPFANHEFFNYEIKGSRQRDGYGILIDTSKEVYLHLSISLQVSDNIVQGFIVYFGTPMKTGGNFGIADMGAKHYERYGIYEVLRNHGVPNEMYLIPTGTKNTLGAYGIIMIYVDTRIMVDYAGVAKISENNKYLLCPSIGDGDVGSFILYISNPDEEHIIEFANSLNPGLTLSTYQQGMKKLDGKKIYDLFINENKRCFYEDEYWLD